MFYSCRACEDPSSIQEYTNAVINEAIRMFPPVTRIARTVTADTSVKARIFDNNSLEKLRELDVKVKAGGHVVLDVMGLHMSRMSFTQTFCLISYQPFPFLKSACLGRRR